ncbi:CU044_2847 family protein [Micromonospora sp. WMMD961]|uniref:CU044_2847 family protein n=1 Tax=Micromonospora sp. WMMD961 TaxID=3016100 RepID=UPI0024163D55|nr:CU044_2847 family protein [Micromonospora sp. WMMD961]MDG4779393.1 CU044_2847 family protein [Micromonospora sp. WMMD961]
MSVRRIPGEINGVPVLVEVVPIGDEYTSTRPAQQKAEELFVKAQSVIEGMVASTAEMMRSAAYRAARPSQVEVQFGLKFSTQAGVIFASAASEASLNVKLVFGSVGVADDETRSDVEMKGGSDERIDRSSC